MMDASGSRTSCRIPPQPTPTINRHIQPVVPRPACSEGCGHLIVLYGLVLTPPHTPIPSLPVDPPLVDLRFARSAACNSSRWPAERVLASMLRLCRPRRLAGGHAVNAWAATRALVPAFHGRPWPFTVPATTHSPAAASLTTTSMAAEGGHSGGSTSSQSGTDRGRLAHSGNGNSRRRDRGGQPVGSPSCREAGVGRGHPYMPAVALWHAMALTVAVTYGLPLPHSRQLTPLSPTHPTLVNPPRSHHLTPSSPPHPVPATSPRSHHHFFMPSPFLTPAAPPPPTLPPTPAHPPPPPHNLPLFRC